MDTANAESTNKHKASNEDPKVQDCLSCKIIGSTSLIIASVYVLRRGLQTRRLDTKLISGIFGSSLGYTGIARYFDLFPFNGSQNSTNELKADDQNASMSQKM